MNLAGFEPLLSFMRCVIARTDEQDTQDYRDQAGNAKGQYGACRCGQRNLHGWRIWRQTERRDASFCKVLRNKGERKDEYRRKSRLVTLTANQTNPATYFRTCNPTGPAITLSVASVEEANTAMQEDLVTKRRTRQVGNTKVSEARVWNGRENEEGKARSEVSQDTLMMHKPAEATSARKSSHAAQYFVFAFWRGSHST